MTFNWEISLGTVIQMATILIAALAFSNKLGKLESKLNIMFDWFTRSVIRGGGGPDDRDIRRFHGDSD